MEMMVIVSLLVLLISMLLPSYRGAKERGRATVCLSQVHAIGQAHRMYGDDSKDAYPYGVPQPHTVVEHPQYKLWQDGGGGGLSPQQQFYNQKYIRDMDAWICPTDPSPEDYIWWHYDVTPDIKASSYMFSEDALFGVAWKDRILLTFGMVFQPSKFVYMTDGYICPNGWSWDRVDPHTPKAFPWDLRIDWTHLGTVNALFGDQHAEPQPQRDAGVKLREHPLEDY